MHKTLLLPGQSPEGGRNPARRWLRFPPVSISNQRVFSSNWKKQTESEIIRRKTNGISAVLRRQLEISRNLDFPARKWRLIPENVDFYFKVQTEIRIPKSLVTSPISRKPPENSWELGENHLKTGWDLRNLLPFPKISLQNIRESTKTDTFQQEKWRCPRFQPLSTLNWSIE